MYLGTLYIFTKKDEIAFTDRMLGFELTRPFRDL
jgi:hypothetical protein